MVPSQLEYDASLPQSQETTHMLQTINTTLNDIQSKLSMLQNQYTQQDAQLKKLEESIKNLKRMGGQEKNASKPIKSRKSPRGLSVSYIYERFIITIMLYCFRLVYVTFM